MRGKNILIIYNKTQTYTNTIYDHLVALGRGRGNAVFYHHHDGCSAFRVELQRFDVVIIHYSIRLAFDQISPELRGRLKNFCGLKALFIQDEYDNTKRVWEWIRELGIGLVFTCVPQRNIEKIYPADEFPGVRFVNNLTGYVPERLPKDIEVSPPSGRRLVVGYRGRELSIRYGALSREKAEIGRMVKRYCERHKIPHDIAWDEKSRIYGDDWYRFLASCRAMLGTESGSNVFDWNGDLSHKINEYRSGHRANDEEVYAAVVEPLEQPGIMNQISPKVFEAICFKSVLVLFEGEYSGVLEAGRHYISLKKDGSNLGEVFELLLDDDFVDSMAERAYLEIIKSGKYSYSSFAEFVYDEIGRLVRARMDSGRIIMKNVGKDQEFIVDPTCVTTNPVRWKIENSFTESGVYGSAIGRLVPLWMAMPAGLRKRLRDPLKALLRFGK